MPLPIHETTDCGLWQAEWRTIGKNNASEMKEVKLARDGIVTVGLKLEIKNTEREKRFELHLRNRITGVSHIAMPAQSVDLLLGWVPWIERARKTNKEDGWCAPVRTGWVSAFFYTDVLPLSCTLSHVQLRPPTVERVCASLARLGQNDVPLSRERLPMRDDGHTIDVNIVMRDGQDVVWSIDLELMDEKRSFNLLRGYPGDVISWLAEKDGAVQRVQQKWFFTEAIEEWRECVFVDGVCVAAKLVSITVLLPELPQPALDPPHARIYL